MVNSSLLSLLVAEEVVPTFSTNNDLFQTFEEVHKQGVATVLTKDHLTYLNESNIQHAGESHIFPLLNGKIVLIPLELYDSVRAICGEKENYWEDQVCSFAVLCSFKPLAIVQEVAKEKWFYPKRWFSKYGRHLMKTKGPDLNCSYFRINLRTAKGDFAPFSNETGLVAQLHVLDSSLDSIRSYFAIVFVIFFRAFASTGYVILTLLSVAFFVTRLRMRKLNSVYVFLYFLTAATCLSLAIVCYTGPFFLFEIRSPTFERFQVGYASQFDKIPRFYLRF